MALVADLKDWVSLSKNPFKLETKQAVIDAFSARWEGTVYSTGTVRKVGIKKDVHIAAYYMNPAILDLNDTGGTSMIEQARQAVKKVTRRFFPEGLEGEVKNIELMKEFDAYINGEGLWASARKEIAEETKTQLSWLHEKLGGPPDTNTERMIMKLTMAGDSRLWWSQRNCSAMFKNIAIRLASMDVASIGTERINKHYKTVVTASRTAMAHARSMKAVFVYSNLRFMTGIQDATQNALV